MTNRADLEALAVRAEQATGLLAEEVAIDVIREAWKMLNPMPQVRVSRQASGEPWGGDGLGPYTSEYKAWEAHRVQIEAYLRAGASLDAALTLLPEGWRVSNLREDETEEARWFCTLGVREGRFGAPGQHTSGATAALALTAAALRAHAATKGATDDR